jgi:hypothetical protein
VQRIGATLLRVTFRLGNDQAEDDVYQDQRRNYYRNGYEELLLRQDITRTGYQQLAEG